MLRWHSKVAEGSQLTLKLFNVENSIFFIFKAFVWTEEMIFYSSALFITRRIDFICRVLKARHFNETKEFLF